MEDNFDYNKVPKTFSHCVNTQCTRSDECIRYRLMSHINADREMLPIVNYKRFAITGEDCTFFFPDRKIRFALGITHLLDNVPHSKIADIKYQLHSYFSKGTYYRISRKQRLINPAEQNFIRQVFLDKGIEEEPVFDKYIEEYEW